MSGPQLKVKSVDISKRLVFKAWERVRANAGAPGVDAVTTTDFASKERANLYKLWNRMSSGGYFPGPVRGGGDTEGPRGRGQGFRGAEYGRPNRPDRSPSGCWKRGWSRSFIPTATARIEANLARWPEQPWVRVHAGDDLQELGDAEGAEAHFLAALEMTEEADDFELRSDVFDRLAALGRAPGPRTTIRLAGPAESGRRSRSARLGRNDPCFCGSGRKYKYCHGQMA